MRRIFSVGLGQRRARATRRLAAAALVALGLAPAACGQAPEQPPSIGGFVPDNKPAPPIRWADATLPAGTKIELTLQARPGGEPLRVGTLMKARVAAGVVDGSLLAIPEGSTVEGIVTAVTPGRPPVLAFRVVSTPTGASAAIVAHTVAATTPPPPPRAPGETPLTIVLDQPLSIKVRQ